MRNWLSPILAALTVAAVAPTLAGAAGHRRCTVDLTAKTAPVETTGNPPLNGSETRGGIVDGKLCGRAFHGAVRFTLTFTAPGKATVTGTDFGPQGSFRETGRVVGTPHPDGSVSVSGGAKVTGGTGLYNGATGSLSITGTLPAHSDVISRVTTGTIKP